MLQVMAKAIAETAAMKNASGKVCEVNISA
jgi:hypothetical protein